MNRTFTLFIAIALFSAQSFSQNTFVNNGNSATYSLNNGDSLHIAAGTYTGKINSFNQGAKISVAQGATFQPETFGNGKGILTVYGTAKFNADLKPGDNFTIHNYGVIWCVNNAELNGNSIVLNNYFGGSIRFGKDLTLNNNNALVNRGMMTVTGNVTLNSNASITNKYVTTISGNFTLNSSSQITNEGTFQANGSMTFNSSGQVKNMCRLIAGAGITNNSNNVTNDGLIWAKASANTNTNLITNSGKITNSANARVKSVNFTNYGTLAGSGYYYFTGTTYNTGTTGVSGNTTDTIRIYDVTRSNANTIFDTQWGTVRPNTKYVVFAAPDTTNNFGNCSVELISNVPLPIKWNYFHVNVSNNTPALNWGAQPDPGTVFEIERSYDGSVFSSIETMNEDGKTVFSYTDSRVNSNMAAVYYRIKAVEPTGVIKYSETRVVKFSTKNGISIQAVPNPFTSQLSISYQSAAREMLTIRIINMAGQVQVNKIVMMNSGFNSIAIAEAAGLTKGVYMLQISNSTTTIASEKIVKQ